MLAGNFHTIAYARAPRREACAWSGNASNCGKFQTGGRAPERAECAKNLIINY